ncbi:MAG: 50S ribosomal protein L25 [Candidatus Omnitrophota bacterium]
MEKVIIEAVVREELKKSGCKHLRKEGRIPAVVYKSGKVGVNVHVDAKELWQAMHTEAGENAIITMNIDDKEKTAKKTVIVQEVQRDPVNDKLIHVDFHEISLKEKIKVSVPITIKGEAPGVTEEEGILTQVIWEIEIECLPTSIPEHLDVRVDELHIGDAVHVKEMKIPEGIKVLEDPESVVVSVSPPMAEEEKPEEEETLEEEGVEPEVIKKGKKEAEDDDEAAPTKEKE